MIIPVVMASIFLGRAFDMKNVAPTSKWIFDNKEAMDNIVTIHKPFTRSQYNLVQTTSDASNFLDVSGDLTLKVKTGEIGLRGHGMYMSRSVNREKTVEILLSVYHETVTETFPSYIKPRTDWMDLPQTSVGTHYIRSIIYGGQLIISFRMKAKTTGNMEEIKAAVDANVRLYGSLDSQVIGNLEKIISEVESISEISIDAYATAGVFNSPTDMKGVLKLIDEYPSMVKKINNGKGAPLRLELIPLKTLNPRYDGYFKSQAISEILDEAANKLEDIQVSIDQYHEWEKSTDMWPDEYDAIISDYARQLKRAQRAMVKAVNELDLSKKFDQHHFQEAFAIYSEGGFNIPNRYTRNLTRLMHLTKNEPFHWYPYTKSVTHYVHWGSVNCSLPSPDPLLVGLAAASPSGFGNGGSIECLDVSHPEFEAYPHDKKYGVSTMNGLKFETIDGKRDPLFCARCRLENATAVITVTAQKECPKEMKLEYRGFLATSRDAVSEYVCIDNNPDVTYRDIYPKQDDLSSVVHPMSISCPECKEDKDYYYVPCVVCSR